jgi:dephospho-CoA kinase
MVRRKSGLVVGITGGIASGKTTVARELEKQGAHLIDADRIGREVVESLPEVQRSLRNSFVDSIFGGGGRVNRRRLADRVFSDGDALGKLNRIVHPHLLKELHQRVESLRGESRTAVVVIDAALLVEWGAEDWVDYLVVVEADRGKQIEHIETRNGFSREQAKQRITSQVHPQVRARVADEVLRNDGSLEDLTAAARDLWQRLQVLAGDSES